MRIEQIKNIMAKKSIDLVGVVTESEERSELKRKADGSTVAKKVVTLADDSGAAITMTLWGNELCDKFDNLTVGNILAVKGARVSDYLGRTLNAGAEYSQLFTTLDHKSFKRI